LKNQCWYWGDRKGRPYKKRGKFVKKRIITKKFISLALVLILMFALMPATVTVSADDTVAAIHTNLKVVVNGKDVTFDAYNINDNNYFKLRDLAYILNGTEKQFEVNYTESSKSITLTSGKIYTAVGGEMAVNSAENNAAAPTTSTIYLDGKKLNLTAYNIGGNNYFKLRDIGEVMDFNVSLTDGNTVINTSEHYFDDTIERYYNYVNDNPQIIMLFEHPAGATGFTDGEMAAFSILLMGKLGYADFTNGNSKEEFDKITEKYFGKKIENFDNSKSYIIPETGMIAPTGWDSGKMYMVLKSFTETPDGVKTAVFYMLVCGIGDDWGDANTIKKDLLSGNFNGYGKTYLVNMQFIEKYDLSGGMYFQFISLNELGETNEKPTPYSTKADSSDNNDFVKQNIDMDSCTVSMELPDSFCIDASDYSDNTNLFTSEKYNFGFLTSANTKIPTVRIKKGNAVVGAISLVNFENNPDEQFGYYKEDPVKNFRALYFQLPIGSLVNWGAEYKVVYESDDWQEGTATVLSYYRSDFFDGTDITDFSHFKQETIEGNLRINLYNRGILGYNRDINKFVKIELYFDAVTNEELTHIAESLRINLKD